MIKNSALSVLSATGIALTCPLPAFAQANSSAGASEVRGVNPAEILSRADLIVKATNLPGGESIAAVAKYDKKLGDGIAANAEFPFASYVKTGGSDAFGVGDLFVRIRYVIPLSQSLVGLASAEVAAPTASNALLGTGKWQLNPSAGAVKIWSQRSFTAVLYKHSFSIAGKDSRADIDVNQVRALQTFILNKGFYVTVDGRHEWQSKGFNQNWTTTELDFGKQFTPRLAASMRIGKAWGDRKNDGSIDFNVRTFF